MPLLLNFINPTFIYGTARLIKAFSKKALNIPKAFLHLFCNEATAIYYSVPNDTPLLIVRGGIQAIKTHHWGTI